MRKNTACFSLLFALILLGSCRTTAIFDKGIFVRTSELKARVLVLMDHATEPYETHSAYVDSLQVEAHAIAAMDKAREKNIESAALWDKMLGTNTSLLGGFFRLWKEKKVLPQAYIDDKKEQVYEGFDKILKLEGAKLKN